jgi:hypothetical protein
MGGFFQILTSLDGTNAHAVSPSPSAGGPPSRVIRCGSISEIASTVDGPSTNIIPHSCPSMSQACPDPAINRTRKSIDHRQDVLPGGRGYIVYSCQMLEWPDFSYPRSNPFVVSFIFVKPTPLWTHICYRGRRHIKRFPFTLSRKPIGARQDTPAVLIPPLSFFLTITTSLHSDTCFS